MQLYGCHFTFQHSTHHDRGICCTMDLAFQFPFERSRCPTIATTLTRLSSHHNHTITLNFAAAKAILHSMKEMVVAGYQILTATNFKVMMT